MLVVDAREEEEGPAKLEERGGGGGIGVGADPSGEGAEGGRLK